MVFYNLLKSGPRGRGKSLTATREYSKRLATAIVLPMLIAFLAIAGTEAAVASSGCPNESLLGFQAYLPGCRAYEMVSPSYKEGFSTPAVGVAEDGQQVLAESNGSYLTPEGSEPEGIGPFGLTYRLMRTAAGWASAPIDAPFAKFPKFEVIGLSPDFASSLAFGSVPGQSSADLYIRPAGGTLTEVGPGAPPGIRETSVNFIGASEDLTHSLFSAFSPSEGLEEDGLWPGDTTTGGRRPSLYEYTGSGNPEPTLVGVSDEHRLAHVAESHLISNCGTLLGGGHQPQGGDVYNAISASGALVFFTAEECGGSPTVKELYARVDQERTIAISEPPFIAGRACAGACVTTENTPGTRKPAAFVGASLDGSWVYFMTQQSLVNGDEAGDGSGMDLYGAEIMHGAVTRLVQVSSGGEGDATPGSGAEVMGVSRVSEDGSHVYFVAAGTLTGVNGEGKAPVAGAPNLYVFSRQCPEGEANCGDPVERTSFVATLSATEDGADWGSADVRPVQTTPEGRFLVFQSTADLTPDQEGRKEAGQVFEYDAQAETLARVSRGQNGYNEDGNSGEYPAKIPIQNEELGRASTPARTRFYALAMSADGSRVVFTSEDALTPQALRGITNIYEAHDGHVGLISDGHDVLTESGHTTTSLIGIDESGSDVFFTTADALVPQDTDAQVDIYDARIDGGFAPVPEPVPCSPAACRGSAGESLSLLTPLSTSVVAEAVGAPVGTGPLPKHKVTKKKAKKRKRAPRRSKAHGGKKAKTGKAKVGGK